MARKNKKSPLPMAVGKVKVPGAVITTILSFVKNRLLSKFLNFSLNYCVYNLKR